jgi:hypothetical protein
MFQFFLTQIILFSFFSHVTLSHAHCLSETNVLKKLENMRLPNEAKLLRLPAHTRKKSVPIQLMKSREGLNFQQAAYAVKKYKSQAYSRQYHDGY